MRSWLTILIICVNAISYGQSLPELNKRLRLLENRGDFQHDTTGFSSLPKLDYFCDNENQNKSDYYHVADLNQDGLNDLIYSGPCKPYSQTGIFLNTGMAFKKIHNYPGELISIDKTTSGTVINILRAGCCCDYYSEYIQLKIDKASNVTKNTMAFGVSTKIKLGAQLKGEKVVGIIRTTPRIDDMNRKDSCRNQMIKGNHLIRIDNFKNIIQLNRVGSWWLVLYPQNKERSLIGWMKMNE